MSPNSGADAHKILADLNAARAELPKPTVSADGRMEDVLADIHRGMYSENGLVWGVAAHTVEIAGLRANHAACRDDMLKRFGVRPVTVKAAPEGGLAEAGEPAEIDVSTHGVAFKGLAAAWAFRGISWLSVIAGALWLWHRSTVVEGSALQAREEAQGARAEARIAHTAATNLLHQSRSNGETLQEVKALVDLLQAEHL